MTIQFVPVNYNANNVVQCLRILVRLAVVVLRDKLRQFSSQLLHRSLHHRIFCLARLSRFLHLHQQREQVYGAHVLHESDNRSGQFILYNTQPIAVYYYVEFVQFITVVISS